MKTLFFICLCSASIFGQNAASLSGRVTIHGVPEGGATVDLVSSTDRSAKFTTKTDSAGRYRFENIPVGRYKVNAALNNTSNHPTLLETAREVNLEAGETKILDLDLTGSQNLIEASVTISAGFDQPINEISKTVNVIDGQEMRDRADFSLAETLQTIPGFRVQQLGGFGRTATIKTRGLRNQDTAVLIDGIRFRDPSAITGDASPFLSDFTLTSVSRIEVLRGSGSSLYGTNAIGGTLDFQTPEPKPGLHGQLSGAGGGLGLARFRGNLSDGTNDGKFGFNLGVSRTAYTKGIDGQDNAHNTNFQSRIEYNPFSKTNISARFFVSDAFVRLNSNPDTLGELPFSNAAIIDAKEGVNFVFDQNDPDDFQRSQFFDGQLVLAQVIDSRLVFNGYYSGVRTSRKNDSGPLGVGFQSASTSIFNGLIQTANGHFNWTPNAANEITAGYEFEAEKFGNRGFTPGGFDDFFTKAYQNSNTFYAQDLVRLLKGKLQLAGGFRAQMFDLRAPKFSLVNAPYSNLTLERPPTAYTFDGAASYFVEKTRTKLRAHVGNGYRVPSLFERFGTFFSSFGTPEFIALGDPHLKPEKTIAADGGIEQYIFGDKAKLTAVYFYTKLLDTIGFGNFVPDIGSTPRPFGGYENQKGGIARGIELSGKLQPTRSTEVFASYTLTKSLQREPQVFGNSSLETLGIPVHQFTLVATQRFERFWVNLDLLATSSYLAPIFSNSTFNSYVYRFRGNRKADLTAGYTFPLNRDKMNLRLYGTVENVFDHEYFENGFRTPGRNGRLGLTFGF
jgi:iron complex outermembrane receptor protein